MRVFFSLLLVSFGLFGVAACSSSADNTVTESAPDTGGGATSNPGPNTVSGTQMGPGSGDGQVLASPDGGYVLDAFVPIGPNADAGVAPVMRQADIDPVSIETRLQYEVTAAGDANQVVCEILGPNGEQIVDLVPAVDVSPDISIQRGESGLIAQATGEYRVACTVPAFGLRDETPVLWTVKGGKPAQVRTEVAPSQIRAGENVNVQCDVTDSFGNLLNLTGVEVTFNPEPEAISTRDGFQFSLTSVGVFDVACSVEGAASSVPARLQVLPGPANRLFVTRVPEQPVYRQGDVLQVLVEALDEFGNNVVDVMPEITINPPLQALGAQRYLLENPGRYQFGVTLPGGLPALTEQFEIIVDEGGPTVTCLEPAFGAQIVLPPGGRINLVGQTADMLGVSEVMINGRPVPFNQDDGRFSQSVAVGWGLNAFEVKARDSTGTETETLCAFFAASDYLSVESPLEDAVVARLGTNALDDGEGTSPLESLGDVVRTVANSDGLVTLMNEQGRALNPILPVTCILGAVGLCAADAGIDFRSLDIGGPNDVSIRFIEGGLHVHLEVSDIEVQGQLLGTLSNAFTVNTCMPGTRECPTGRITADAYFDVGLTPNGTVNVTLLPIMNVTVPKLEWTFEGGITAWLLERAAGLMERFFKTAIVDQLKAVIEEEIQGGLRGFFDSLPLDGLGANIEVPSLSGGAPTVLALSTAITSIQMEMTQGLFGVSTRVTASQPQPGRQSLGVPLPPETPALPPATVNASGAADIGLVNQVLHELWRAGYFEGEVDALVQMFGATLPGVEVELNIRVPPAAKGRAQAGGLTVLVGPLDGQVRLPAVRNDPFLFRATGEVEVEVQLGANNSLTFNDLTVSQLNLAVEGVAVGDAGPNGLETLILNIIRGLVDEVLTRSLPSLPIPQFSTPPEFAEFGIPAGTLLGVVNGQLSNTVRSWLADGMLGEVSLVDPADASHGGLCANTCLFSRDGACDDGGEDAAFSLCDYGSDCADCGVRNPPDGGG
ncbi:MAG: hypothetical protein VX589_13685 [Myxococcota bacterium]|nr:hypothetical protein [Myxococcota bacterium]